MTIDPFTVFFTGKDDCRDGLIVIGDDSKPQFFRFETPDAFLTLGSSTTVYRNSAEVVARFDWTLNTHFGRASVGGRHINMADLVLPGTTANARKFASASGRSYEWKKSEDDPYSYDLFVLPAHTRVAMFRREFQATPVGPSHAYMQYTFDHDPLLLEALLALCLNRWIDYHGL